MAANDGFDHVKCIRQLEHPWMLDTMTASKSFLRWESPALKGVIDIKNIAVNSHTLSSIVQCNGGSAKSPQIKHIYHGLTVLAQLNNVTIPRGNRWSEAKMMRKMYSFASRRAKKNQHPRVLCLHVILNVALPFHFSILQTQ
jgi:hypothetical protein